MKPMFSIVVPTLNEEKFLSKLLTSLCEQTDLDFEVIIADGSSEDKTVSIAKKFEKKLPSLTILTQCKRGVSCQRNAGSAVARGSWIISTDADGTFYPYAISRLKAYIKKRPQKYFACWFGTDTDKPSDALIILMINSGIELSIKMKRPAAYGAFIVTRKDTFMEIGGYDEELEYGEDNDICRRMYEHTKELMGVIREGLVTYSLRRYYKLGIAKTFQLYARASFVLLLTKRTPARLPGYVMGGHVYSEKDHKKRTSVLKEYEKTLKGFIDELTK